MPQGDVRPHYRQFCELVPVADATEFENKRQSMDLAFLRQGITFNVYGDAQGAEKIFPFDLLPRIIPAKEWEHLERGLDAAHHGAESVPARHLSRAENFEGRRHSAEFYVLSGKHFRREFVNFKVPKDIYIHICGTDLIRDDGRQLSGAGGQRPLSVAA